MSKWRWIICKIRNLLKWKKNVFLLLLLLHLGFLFSFCFHKLPGCLDFLQVFFNLCIIFPSSFFLLKIIMPVFCPFIIWHSFYVLKPRNALIFNPLMMKQTTSILLQISSILNLSLFVVRKHLQLDCSSMLLILSSIVFVKNVFQNVKSLHYWQTKE